MKKEIKLQCWLLQMNKKMKTLKIMMYQVQNKKKKSLCQKYAIKDRKLATLRTKI